MTEKKALAALAAMFACGFSKLVTGCTHPAGEVQPTPDPAAAKRRADEERDRFVSMAQNFVKKRLTSPASATFPPPSKASATKIGDNKYRVVTYFDAPGLPGASVRSDYSCEVTRISSARWRCDNLKIEPHR